MNFLKVKLKFLFFLDYVKKDFPDSRPETAFQTIAMTLKEPAISTSIQPFTSDDSQGIKLEVELEDSSTKLRLNQPPFRSIQAFLDSKKARNNSNLKKL